MFTNPQISPQNDEAFHHDEMVQESMTVQLECKPVSKLKNQVLDLFFRFSQGRVQCKEAEHRIENLIEHGFRKKIISYESFRGLHRTRTAHGRKPNRSFLKMMQDFHRDKKVVSRLVESLPAIAGLAIHSVQPGETHSLIELERDSTKMGKPDLKLIFQDSSVLYADVKRARHGQPHRFLVRNLRTLVHQGTLLGNGVGLLVFELEDTFQVQTLKRLVYYPPKALHQLYQGSLHREARETLFVTDKEFPLEVFTKTL